MAGKNVSIRAGLLARDSIARCLTALGWSAGLHVLGTLIGAGLLLEWSEANVAQNFGGLPLAIMVVYSYLATPIVGGAMAAPWSLLAFRFSLGAAVHGPKRLKGLALLLMTIPVVVFDLLSIVLIVVILVAFLSNPMAASIWRPAPPHHRTTDSRTAGQQVSRSAGRLVG